MNWKRYWDIILYRAYAEVKSETQMYYMGYIWWILEPLLNTILFYIILVLVMQKSTLGAVSFLLVGTITWQWFNGSVISSASSILDSGTMLKFIYLPKLVLPLITILAGVWRFAFLFGLLLVWCICSGRTPGLSYLCLPLLLALQMLVILGVSLPIAAIVPYFPDARYAVDVILRSLMLISGVFFSVGQVPAQYQFWLLLNPMAILIDSYRTVLLDGLWPNFLHLTCVGIMGVAALLFSTMIYRRIDLSVVKSIHR